MTKAHAHRIAEVFEEMYPQHVGVIQVITSTTERVRDGSYGDGLITKRSNALASAEAGQLTRLIADLAPLMKNRRNRPSAFLNIDLPDFIETRGYISVGEGGQQIHVEEYRRHVEARILRIVETHPALAAIREGREVSDELLVDLERTLHHELGEGDLHLSPKLIHIAFGLKTDNFLGFLRHVLTLDAIPDYPQVVQRAFEHHVAAHRYNADQIRFLRAVQELFLKQRRLVEADLYEPPLTQFGRNAVDRYFNPAEVREILYLTERLAA